MSLKSPVTGQTNTSLVMKIPVETIVERYRLLNIDVTHYFNDIKDVELTQCNDTGYRFYYPYSIFGDDKFYQELQNKIPGYYIEGRWEHGKSASIINDNEFVLEVGSGSGYFLELLSRRKIDCVGLELNSKAAAEAREKGFTVQTQLLEEYAINNKEKYDVVCSFQVLEHITDPRSYLLNAIDVLRPGGRLIIAVPNNNPYIFKQDVFHTLNLPPHHAGLWNRETFEKIPDFFPLKLDTIFIEPLSEYKEWYNTQVRYLKNKKSPLGSLLSIVPRPLYKMALSLLKNSIEGRNIIAVFKKSK